MTAFDLPAQYWRILFFLYKSRGECRTAIRLAGELLSKGVIILGIVCCFQTAYAQTDSPVFRDYQHPARDEWARFTEPGIGKQLHIFNLLREANQGDAEAQNEIGIRYLTGNGFKPDTARAAYWIRKAAAQDNYSARYNLALFHIYGLGMEWDPFQAFLNFRYAADNGDRHAQYMLGIMYTDNLSVDRDWLAAYHYLRKSSEQGFRPADEVIAELMEQGYITVSDTTTVSVQESAEDEARAETRAQRDSIAAAASTAPSERWSPVFLDFTDTTSTPVPVETILKEALETAGLSSEDSLSFVEWIAGGEKPDSALRNLEAVALTGNPEAMVFIGSAYEHQFLPAQNALVTALQYYIHAVYLDSRRAPQCISRILNTNTISKPLTRLSFENDSVAMFVWSGLYQLKMDSRLNPTQALELMTMAAEGGNIFALVHLGMNYESGIWSLPDTAKAVQIWKEAERLGCYEARTRIAARAILNGTQAEYDRELAVLRQAQQQGSLLAEVALAYASESGTGVVRSTPEAVRLYRLAAIRGSANAYRALESLYESKRPANWNALLQTVSATPPPVE